jgi:uncharacterized membrane-anchored protein
MDLRALAAGLLFSTVAIAQEAAPDATAAFLDSLKFQEGRVTVAAANADIDLGTRYRYLDAADSRRVLEDFWGNPPDDSVLGMIVPRDVSLADDASWAAVLTWQADGYVSDAEASEIDYTELLAEMQEGTASGNADRKAAGYPTIELLGWAEPPRYDTQSKRLYWGKKLAFEGSAEPTLNYDIRVLGRYGVLSMNVVASHSALDTIRSELPQIAGTASFAAGNTYADYQPGTDRVAEYGLAAMIGGGLAAKSGLLGKLFAMLLAAKKLVVLLVLGAVAGIGSLFGKKKQPA